VEVNPPFRGEWLGLARPDAHDPAAFWGVLLAEHEHRAHDSCSRASSEFIGAPAIRLPCR
jgi:hypothetical protein